jgi:hypothetical protein
LSANRCAAPSRTAPEHHTGEQPAERLANDVPAAKQRRRELLRKINARVAVKTDSTVAPAQDDAEPLMGGPVCYPDAEAKALARDFVDLGAPAATSSAKRASMDAIAVPKRIRSVASARPLHCAMLPQRLGM